MEEVWKEVVGFPVYQVSNLGRVRSMRHSGWELKKLKKVQKGYGKRWYYGFQVVVQGERTEGGNVKTKTLLLHCEILKSFVGPRPDGMSGLHNDDVRENNHLTNLKWGTQQENMGQALSNGVMKKSRITLRDSQGRIMGSARGT